MSTESRAPGGSTSRRRTWPKFELHPLLPTPTHRGTGVRACEEQLRYLGLGSVYHDSSLKSQVSSSSLTPPAARRPSRTTHQINHHPESDSEAHRPTPTSRLGRIRTDSVHISRMYPLDGRCSTLASSAALSRARNKCRTAPRLLAIVLLSTSTSTVSVRPRLQGRLSSTTHQHSITPSS